MASESPDPPGCHFVAPRESVALISTCSQVSQLGVRQVPGLGVRRTREVMGLLLPASGFLKIGDFKTQKRLHNCGTIEEARETRPVVNWIQWRFLKFFKLFI